MTNNVFEINGIGNWLKQIEVFLAALLLLFDLIMFVSKSKKEKKEKHLYAILFAIAMLLMTDVLAVDFSNNTSKFGRFVEVFANCAYYISNYLAPWCVVRYTLEVIRSNGKEPSKIIGLCNNIIFCIALIAIVCNLKFEFYYYIDAQNVYHRGPVFLLAIIPVAIMMVVLGITLMTYRKCMSVTEQLAILSYIILPVTAEIFQVLDYGIAWEPLAMAFSAFIIMIYNFLSRTKKKNTRRSGLLNQENKVLQTRILLFVSILIIIFFGFISRIAISFASIQMNAEVEAHYQMLANKTTEQASAWIVRETQILLNQKASIEIINNFDHDFLTDYFSYVVNDYNYDRYIYDIYFVNTDNEMAAGSGYVQDSSIDFRERDWYTGAMSSDNMCYTAPYVDVDTGKFIVTVSIKVFDRNRRFVGVLAVDIFVEKLFSITDQKSLPDSSYLFIVDNEMGLVTHPSDKYGYVNESPQNLYEVANDGYQKLAEHIKKEEQKEAYISFEDYDGETRCFFVSKIEDCDWYVVAAISKSVIDEAKNNLGKSIFVALIVCLVLGIIITLWATNNIIRKLTEAQEEANAASEAKSRFLANMSHEIRTPINAVLGMDEILLRECQDEDLKEYARNIQSAGQALLGVVNDILDFSKIESDRLDLVPSVYVVGELVGSCVNLIDLRAQDKGLKFRMETEDYIPRKVYGDVVRVRQIITNLLTNAVKYTKTGEIVLSVGWNKKNDEEGEMVVRVKDTGIGIKEDKLQDLFNAFQRLEEKKNRNIEGTGLGLSITKQLVELMGGSISVESEYGIGSEFTVVIPQKVVDAANTESFEAVQDAQNSRTDIELHTRDAKILVVDDVVMNLQVVKGLLKDTGIEIDVAERGKQAIELMQQNVYDIVFLDHMMPEMDGIETLRILQDEHTGVLRRTPIIMLTANAVLGVEEQYREAGFSGYLSKPIDRNALCDCIISFLPEDKVLDEKEYQEQMQKTEKKHQEQMQKSEKKVSFVNISEKETASQDAKSKEEISTFGDAETDEKVLQYLKNHVPGYDLKQAVIYCGGMEDMVVEILEEYLNSGLGEKLVNAFTTEDVDNYRIHAHSLKSTSLTVGFTDLSENAKALEMAAKNKDWTYIKEHHNGVFAQYMSVLDEVQHAFES